MFDHLSVRRSFLISLSQAALVAAVTPSFHAAWVTACAPISAAPGAAVRLEARVRNAGLGVWQRTGRSRVALTVMLVDSNGNPWPARPVVAPIPYTTPPGGATTVTASVTAPDIPGRYTLLLGVVHRSERDDVLFDLKPAKLPLEVRPKATAPGPFVGPGAAGRSDG